ncbi:MAG: glycoside hydrolase family 95 protein, partial [Marinilabiliales bacterium]|nr:glycoside hydrolase family 95 protein [Marinilabiliales bacterium]
MKKTLLLLLMPIASLTISFAAKRPGSTEPPGSRLSASVPLKVWYLEPADSKLADDKNGWKNDAEWLKALPLGNGFLGAMVFGDVQTERIQLNEKSLWSGSPDDGDNPEAYGALATIRQLLTAGKYREATALTNKTQVCKNAGSGFGNGAAVPYGSFQTLGDWHFDFGRASAWTDYRRELDLSSGMVRIQYKQEGIRFQRELFVSYPDRVLVLRLTADHKGSIGCSTFLDRPERFDVTVAQDGMLMSGTLDNGKGGEGMHYAVRMKVLNQGGKVAVQKGKLVLTGCDAVTLLLTAATDYRLHYPDYKGADPLSVTQEQMLQASTKGFTALKLAHVKDYATLFGKVQLRLSTVAEDTIPTNQRILANNHPEPDLHLQELYFQYGRYLLISSSRRGSLPANLQGIWSNKLQTPWNGDYHTDINVQMNYWPADVTNLAACYDPLTDLIASLVQPGSRTAAIQYHAAGWCVHPITNVWGFTAPGESASWGLHLGAGGWLCQHLWDHYLFTGDDQFLARVYPIMAQSAAF